MAELTIKLPDSFSSDEKPTIEFDFQNDISDVRLHFIEIPCDGRVTLHLTDDITQESNQ